MLYIKKLTYLFYLYKFIKHVYKRKFITIVNTKLAKKYSLELKISFNSNSYKNKICKNIALIIL